MDLDFSRETVEELLLKQILTDKQYMSVISSNFDKRWFKTENISLLYDLAIRFYKKYDKIPSTKLLKGLIRGFVEKTGKNQEISLPETFDLLDTSVGLDYSMDKKILEEYLNDFIRKQALYTAILDNVDNIEKDSDEVLEKCLKRFDEVNKISFSQRDLGMDYFDLDDMAKHWEYITNPEARIPFLWEGFDKYTNGGVLKDGKMLFLFMGQAGLGKSLFLSNLAVNYLKQNLKVVVISLEMSQDVYAQRFDAHISTDEINHLKDTAEQSIERIKKFYADHPGGKLYIKEEPPRSIRTSDIEVYLENLKLAGKDFDIVIVDYLNLILPQITTDNMYQGVLNVTERLRALSYKFKCPFISATQSNRVGMNNENIGLEHLSESSGIGHTADAIFSLFQMPEDRENGIINVRITKNRLGGQVGKVIPMQVNPENLVITDLSMESNISDFVETKEEREANKILQNISQISSDIESL